VFKAHVFTGHLGMLAEVILEDEPVIPEVPSRLHDV
jgi:hypothetical protein